jgi:hypothetical protein
MQKLMIAALVWVLCSSASQAQNTPIADIAGGYSVIQVAKGINVTAYGGSGSVALNVNNWFGVVGDFGLYHASPFGPGIDAGTYTFGPRFSYRRWNRFTPFAQALVGGVRYSANGLAFGSGGGAEIGLDGGGRFALRPQLEYFGFCANGATTHTIRVSLGLVFRIGRR